MYQSNLAWQKLQQKYGCQKCSPMKYSFCEKQPFIALIHPNTELLFVRFVLLRTFPLTAIAITSQLNKPFHYKLTLRLDALPFISSSQDAFMFKYFHFQGSKF